ncbi:ATP-binding cassette domain-containing protein [Nonomuraea salmonea]|uniref:ATP-binding cassette domain-containing protein n=1 Tax=Nonomuraea salmonea TaxID=46181 RepID=UPI002FEC594D
MKGNALELKAVTRAYGQVTALGGVDLDVAEGETVAVLGPNGAGKSTLLSVALGLRAPDAGTATVLGGAPLEALRTGRVGVLPQESGLLEDVRVGELVSAVAGMYPGRPDPGRALRAAGIEELARRPVGRLSGGSGSGCGSRCAWRAIRSCSCWTSRPWGWTSRAAAPCGRRSGRGPRGGVPPSSPPTT